MFFYFLYKEPRTEALSDANSGMRAREDGMRAREDGIWMVSSVYSQC